MTDIFGITKANKSCVNRKATKEYSTLFTKFSLFELKRETLTFVCVGKCFRIFSEITFDAVSQSVNRNESRLENIFKKLMKRKSQNF